MEKHPFPVGTPEKAGIPSSALIKFLNAIKRQRVCLHSFMILRHGEVAYEANWAPMTPTELHRMYSVSKSFVSVAVGIAQGEGLLSIHDRVVDYFPERVTKHPHPYLEKVTIRDLLMMSSMFDDQPYDGAKDMDWISTFFNTIPQHASGEVMCYDTMCTVLCTAIVEKVSGQTLMEYLRPRLFDPIGFSEDAWCVQTPCGLTWAGSGIMCSIHDLAKFANVVMHYGEFEGKQLIPRDYMIEATSYQINNMVNSCTLQEGYGYQFWRYSNNGFGCLGMGSQWAMCLPDLDMVVVCTGDTQELQQRQYAAINLFYDVVYPEIAEGEIAVDADAAAKLAAMTADLSIQTVPGEVFCDTAARIAGKTFKMNANPLGWKYVRFDFEGDEGVLSYENARGEKQLRFGLCKQVISAFPETHYSGKRIMEPKGVGYRCATSAAWDVAGNLTMYCYIIDDYFGTLKINFGFRDDSVTVYASKVAEWFLDDYQGSGTGHLA